ncbi:MAG: ectoine/hydroxyectoine ABC transporter substrate-binding protein EhuB [Betaproteobacteria bacterium]|nr:ectoine/hydroxyectoine ABC transporter substrate-binding protein EhuB [Betaproteobacteria bacterium]
MARTQRTAVLLAVGAAVTAWLAWLAIPGFTDDSLTRIERRGVIRIGYAVEAPFAYRSDSGEITGEAPELARYVVSRLGIPRTEWIQADFGELIDGLAANRFDVVAAGMFVTPARAKRVLFSEPTCRVLPALLVRRGNPRGLHAYEDFLRGPELRVAALSGAVEERVLREIGVPETRILLVPDAKTGLAAVETGASDGLALSAPTIHWMAARDRLGQTEIATPFHASPKQRDTYAAVAFRNDDPALRDAWNAVLAPYVGSPAHLALVARFGFGRGEMPGNVRTESLVAP